MMSHLDEGMIQAFLDRELSGSERDAADEHLVLCADCRAIRDELDQVRAVVSRAMPLLDSVPPPRPGRLPRRGGWRAAVGSSLTRAAILVLFLAAAASAAVPGSPVREWLFPPPQAAPAVEPVRDAAPAPPAAVDVVTVEGVVRTRDGGPLAFARVGVVGGYASGWTDEAGVYRLEGVGGERWTVRATHPGHEPLERGLDLPAAGVVSLNFSLEKVPGPSPEPLADFRPFQVAYTLPALLNGDEVAAAIQRQYPEDLLGGAGGAEAVLRLWLDEQGRVARSTLSASSGDARLDSIALTVSRDMRFRPARNRDEAVRVIVQIPVLFDPEI